tara:strand:- start:5188 stop:5739 length:552 start_codon:yes stop_codon:yes gene_type:complete
MSGGFRPVRNDGGYESNGSVTKYHIAAGHATLLAVGDAVISTGTAHTDGTPQCDAAAAGGLLTGVIQAFEFDAEALGTKGLAASTANYVFVNTDPNQIYACETSTTIAVTDTDSNADIVVTAATSSGNLVNSNMTLGTIGTSATAQMRIVRLIEATGGDLGTAIGSTVHVRINESTITGVVGV